MAQNGTTFLYKQMSSGKQTGTVLHEDPIVTEFSLDVPLPEFAAPRCSVLAWTVQPETKSFLAAALELKVDGFVRQTVKASFNPDTVRPSRMTELVVESGEPCSALGMFAVDKSVKLLKSGNDIAIDDVIKTVTGGAERPNPYYRPVYPIIVPNGDKDSDWCTHVKAADVEQIFQVAFRLCGNKNCLNFSHFPILYRSK